MSRLTHKRKIAYFQLLVERDDHRCFYCEKGFSESHPAEYDHLNNNPNDSRPENLVLCHHECNNKKKFNTDWQIEAQEKLLANERTVFVCERRQADTGTTEELTSSQRINQVLEPIARQWLEEHLLMEKEIVLRDAVNAIVNLCRKQTGHGSQATIYRYIDIWCNPYNGHLTISKNEKGVNTIHKRTDN
jgi:hypothetical protein